MLIESYPKQKTVRLKGKKLRKLRQECYDRAEGCCEECGAPASWEGPVFSRGHMHHKKHRSLGGDDCIYNTEWLCPTCHTGNGGKHGTRWGQYE